MEKYYDYLQTPWGKLFYRVLWAQMERTLLSEKRLSILDFGSGFGKTADYLASKHQVIAYEPNEKMLSKAYCENHYHQMTGSHEVFIQEIRDKKFDLIILHKVLEYVPRKTEVLQFLENHLEDGGCMSIVKHHQMGEIFAQTVFFDNPQKALDIYY